MPARPSDGQGAGASAGSAPRLKLVIRRLPPALPEETFWKSVAPFVTDQTCQWKRYVKGRAADAFGAHPVHSRAYCLMTTPDALIAFHRGFDGHVFRSKTGAEYQAVVEYAPLQKTPLKTKVKVDARQATIDDDPDYKSFLESLNAPATKPALEVSGMLTLPPPQPTSTPLLDHLRAHAKSGGKASRKAKAESSSTDIARNSALASVSAAAARRAPQNQGGVVMVAGKGRDVKITASGSGDTQATATEGKGKQKEGGGGKGKGKKGKGGGGGGAAGEPAAKGQKQGSSKTATDKATTATATAAALTPGASKASVDSGRQSPADPAKRSQSPARGGAGGSGGRGRGRGRGKGAGGGGGGGGGGNAEGGGSGPAERAGGGGRGRGDGRERTARGAVMEILTRNSESDRGGRGGGRGGRGGRGGGAAGGTGGVGGASTVLPSEARIDA